VHVKRHGIFIGCAWLLAFLFTQSCGFSGEFDMRLFFWGQTFVIQKIDEMGWRKQV